MPPSKLRYLQMAVEALRERAEANFLVVCGRSGTGKRTAVEFLLRSAGFDLVHEDSSAVQATARALDEHFSDVPVNFAGPRRTDEIAGPLSGIAHAFMARFFTQRLPHQDVRGAL